MRNRLFSMFTVALTVVMLTSCFQVTSSETSSVTSVSSSVEQTYTVAFDTHGGSSVANQTVTVSSTASEPADPTYTDADGVPHEFVGWYVDPSSSTTLYNFASPVTANVTLHAVWVAQKVARFVTKTASTIDPVFLTSTGGTVSEPATLTREGYAFGGWFKGKPGLTWLETEPVEFPLDTTESVVLYAYWEPLNSKTVSYTADETYYSTLSSAGPNVLNPLVYTMSHEDALIGDMATSLYSTEVDWDKAMADGIADYIGDFSKIEAAEYSIEAFDYSYVLIGATRYPVDSDGEDHTIDGKYDRDGASQFTDTEWTYHIRDDIYFEDGSPVTAYTFKYSLQQYLDPIQKNFRSTGYYKDELNNNGYPILNASEYYKQTAENPVSWDSVGFEIIDNYSFKITTFEAISQASAVGFGNIRLVHADKYAESLNAEGTDSTYGTPANPYVSYGAYLIKSWDENQMLVMNKNYTYVRRDLITYKSIVYEFTATVDENMALFENGQLSSVGLIGAYYTEYAENPNVYRSWSGYPQYLIINYAPSKKATDAYEKNPITADERFRQALFFGMDRAAYGSTVYAPNTPSVMPIPLDTKAYIQDPLYYSESPNHAEILDEAGIVAGTNGYIPEKAIQLFDAAYADMLLDNPTFTGPVELKLITNNDALSLSLANWIKNQYETVFNPDPANPTKLKVNVVDAVSSSTSAARAAWDFDLIILNLGFGISYGAQWMYPFMVYLGGATYPSYGLQIPYGADGVNMADDEDSWVNQTITIDLTPTYDFLVEKGEDWIYEVDEEEEYLHQGHIMLYEALKEDGDKDAGIYEGSLYYFADLVYTYDTPYDGSASAPFPGATQEVWKIVAEFERVFYQQMPLIPTVTRNSATLYAENIEILWPKYSTAFGWGPTRYRYLTSDSDFEFGFYNQYQAAAEAAE